jgi:hypothetical protein
LDAPLCVFFLCKTARGSVFDRPSLGFCFLWEFSVRGCSFIRGKFFSSLFSKDETFFFLEVVATSMRKFGKFVLETGCFFFLLSLYICEKVCRLCFRTVKKFGEFVWKRGLFFSSQLFHLWKSLATLFSKGDFFFFSALVFICEKVW